MTGGGKGADRAYSRKALGVEKTMISAIKTYLMRGKKAGGGGTKPVACNIEREKHNGVV